MVTDELFAPRRLARWLAAGTPNGHRPVESYVQATSPAPGALAQ
jgi:hypothetical protein